MTSKAARLEAKLEKQDKQEEKDAVRREKAADDDMSRKLREVYGGPAKKFDSDQRGKRAWVCPECNHKNFESRDACSMCLAPNPASIRDKQPNQKAPAVNTDPDMKIVRVKDRCYRVFRGESPAAAKAAKKAAKEKAEAQQQQAVVNVEDFRYSDSDDEPSCGPAATRKKAAADGPPRITYDNGEHVFQLKLPVPSKYFKFLIGKGGRTLQETERMTETTIDIPGDDDPENTPVIISGETESSVSAAHIRIDAIILENQGKVDYTHFLSIPLGPIPSVKHAMQTLLHDMVAACVDEDRAIESSMFIPPGKLHLTLLCLRLHTDEDLAKCKAILRELEIEMAKTFTSRDLITLKGLNYMNDDPTEVHVVYLEIERDEVREKITKLIQRINEMFISSGIAFDQDVQHNEKLHATVINSKWRESTADGGPRLSFDATNVFQLFGKVALGSHKLDRLELNVFGGERRTGEAEGYYSLESFINFPK